MKKIITILLISALGSALLLAGCGNKNTGTDQPEVPDASAASEPESNPGGMILGGWTASADAASTLTDEEKETLEKAGGSPCYAVGGRHELCISLHYHAGRSGCRAALDSRGRI